MSYRVRVMVFNVTFNNILVISVLLVAEPKKTTDLSQVTLSHNVVSGTHRRERDLNSYCNGDRHWLYR